MGLVALYSCDDNSRRLVLAECLAGLSNRLAAVQRCVLVAGANEASLLSEVKSVSSASTGLFAEATRVAVEVDCCGATDSINARVAECSLDHVYLLIIRGGRGRRLDFDVYVVMLVAVSAHRQ